jgi:hypothetical protein
MFSWRVKAGAFRRQRLFLADGHEAGAAPGRKVIQGNLVHIGAQCGHLLLVEVLGVKTRKAPTPVEAHVVTGQCGACGLPPAAAEQTQGKFACGQAPEFRKARRLVENRHVEGQIQQFAGELFRPVTLQMNHQFRFRIL